MKNFSKKSIIATVLVLVGLALSVYLVLNYQSILSRAGTGAYNYINVVQTKNGQDAPITCDNGNCKTQSLHVKFQFNPQKLSE